MKVKCRGWYPHDFANCENQMCRDAINSEAMKKLIPDNIKLVAKKAKLKK